MVNTHGIKLFKDITPTSFLFILGFTIGFCVGMASGALFGGFSALRYGLRGRDLVNNVGKVMIQGGGTFGTFMAIGTGLRC
ncbi:hypothetical protein ACKWTF_001924 [Chironomus riparius]